MSLDTILWLFIFIFNLDVRFVSWIRQKLNTGGEHIKWRNILWVIVGFFTIGLVVALWVVFGMVVAGELGMHTWQLFATVHGACGLVFLALIVMTPGEYTSKPEPMEDIESCKAYLESILNDPRLNREMKVRFISGFAQQNYKVLADLFEEMIEKKEENKDILEFLRTPLKDMGIRPVTYASLQMFLSYLNSRQLVNEQLKPEPAGRGRKVFNMSKRVIDFTISLALLIILSPVMVAIIILLRYTSPQTIRKIKHLGLNGKAFYLYTFRTFPLSVSGIPKGDPMDLIRRYTEEFIAEYETGSIVRKFLIRWSLHRLPELVNVLKGDMSFIGPTPLAVHEFPDLTQEEGYHFLRRLSIRPGMIGKSQLLAYWNPAFTWVDSIQADESYLRSLSLQNDLKILIDAIRAYSRNISPGDRDDWFRRGLSLSEAFSV